MRLAATRSISRSGLAARPGLRAGMCASFVVVRALSLGSTPGRVDVIVAIRIVRLGTPRARGEGVRLGTVRRPPRGVRKSDYAKRDFYDAWLPELAPSAALMKWIHGEDAITKEKWARFA